MDIGFIFIILASIVIIGFLGEAIFKKTGIPDVLLFILVGIILSSIFGVVNREDFGYGAELFAVFALVFILFEGSININFKVLTKSFSKVIALVFLSYIAWVSVAVLIGHYLLGIDLFVSMLIGSVLGGTSSAVVIPLAERLNMREKYRGVLTLESTVNDVIGIVGSVTILELIRTKEIATGGVLYAIAKSSILAIGVGLLAGVIWVYVLYKHEELMKAYHLTIAIILAVFAIVQGYLDASGAIAVLTFGIVLANSQFFYHFARHANLSLEAEVKRKNLIAPSTKHFYWEIYFFVKVFFFVYLGIMMDFTELKYLLYGALIILGMFIIRPIVISIVYYSEEFKDKERTYLEILIPKGLEAAVIASMAVASGYLAEPILFLNIVLSAIFVGILLSAILSFLAQKNLFKGFLPFLHRKKEH